MFAKNDSDQLFWEISVQYIVGLDLFMGFVDGKKNEEPKTSLLTYQIKDTLWSNKLQLTVSTSTKTEKSRLSYHKNLQPTNRLLALAFPCHSPSFIHLAQPVLPYTVYILYIHWTKI